MTAKWRVIKVCTISYVSCANQILSSNHDEQMHLRDEKQSGRCVTNRKIGRPFEQADRAENEENEETDSGPDRHELKRRARRNHILRRHISLSDCNVVKDDKRHGDHEEQKPQGEDEEARKVAHRMMRILIVVAIARAMIMSTVVIVIAVVVAVAIASAVVVDWQSVAIARDRGSTAIVVDLDVVAIARGAGRSASAAIAVEVLHFIISIAIAHGAGRSASVAVLKVAVVVDLEHG